MRYVDPAVGEHRDRTLVIVAGAVFLLTILLFSPVLSNGFVNWDDDVEILANPRLRGFTWDNLAWMFTSFEHGAYKPIPWLVLTAVHAVQGLDPRGFHLASLLVHGLNALLFFAVARSLFRAAAGRHVPFLSLTGRDCPARRDAGSPDAAVWYGALAALLFAFHPLQAEAVAAAHAFGDVTAAAFFLAALNLHLKAVTENPQRPCLKRLAAAWALFAACALSRWQGLSLPFLLVVLDVYPLARLPSDPREWGKPSLRRVWLEKLPFAAVAAGAVLLNLVAKAKVGGFGEAPSETPLSQGFVSLAFYLWKTLWPAELAPYYILAGPFAPSRWSPALCAGIVLGLTTVLVLARRRWPAGLAAWLHYVAALSPTLEFFHRTPMSVHDRYAYVACMGLPLAAVCAAASVVGRSRQRSAAAVLIGVSLLAALGPRTSRQVRVWRGPETLWAHVLEVQPDSFVALSRLGAAIQEADPSRAEALHLRALGLNPAYAEPRFHLGRLNLSRGDALAAAREFEAALTLDPRMNAARVGLAMAHSNEGVRLHLAGDREGAVREFETALKLDPDSPDIRANLSLAKARPWKRGGAPGRRPDPSTP
ncbi:MAG: hypothetical protein HY748_01880 [Elusimicrobia bacterium]|nr:hypothetical protein [Elusimicrobiota bacterium]